MPIACKICIAERGLKGSEISLLPKTEEELIEHIEREHHIPIRRYNETEEQATERLRAAYPEARDPATCKCPGCKSRRSVSELSITCPCCGLTSYNLNDIEQKYCGRCHMFHANMS